MTFPTAAAEWLLRGSGALPVMRGFCHAREPGRCEYAWSNEQWMGGRGESDETRRERRLVGAEQGWRRMEGEERGGGEG